MKQEARTPSVVADSYLMPHISYLSPSSDVARLSKDNEEKEERWH